MRQIEPGLTVYKMLGRLTQCTSLVGYQPFTGPGCHGARFNAVQGVLEQGIIYAGRTAAPALGQRKSSKEFFALFKPLSQAAKAQPGSAGPTSGANFRDQPQHTQKPTQRGQTHVIDFDSD